jgi:transposase
VESLRKRRATGRPSRLNREQREGVIQLHHSGARAAGFSDDRWTTARFALAIQNRFGIRYDPDHVGRIMHQLGLRPRHQVSEPAAMVYAQAMQMGQPAA